MDHAVIISCTYVEINVVNIEGQMGITHRLIIIPPISALHYISKYNVKLCICDTNSVGTLFVL